MADNLNLLNFRFGEFDNLPQDLSAGTVYVTTDEQAMYIDLPDKDGTLGRLRIGDIIIKESVRTSEPPYSEGALYYFAAENALLRYSNNKWVQINEATDLTAVQNQIDAVDTRVTTEAARLDAADLALSGRVQALETAVPNKVNSSDFEAFKTANTEVINGVKATAEKGVKDAATAQNTADGAVSAAGKAQSDATQALTNAATAQGTADNAAAAAAANAEEIVKVSARAEKGISDASTAKAAADAAQGAADAAQTRADNAYSLAESKTTMSAVEGVLVNYATKDNVNKAIEDVQGDTDRTIAEAYALASGAKSAADAAQNTADSKTTMAAVEAVLASYATLTKLSEEKAALLGTENSSAESTTIHGVKKAAAAAQETAIDAASAAAQADGKAVAAQNAADKAQSDATQALTNAAAAQKAADDAQKDATQGINDAAKAKAAADEAKTQADLGVENAAKANALAQAAGAAADAAQTTANQGVTDAAAAKAAADAAAALAGQKLALTGGKMASANANIDMNGATVTGLKAPSANSDAATKAYVDAVSSTQSADKAALQASIDAVDTIAKAALPKAGGQMAASATIDMNNGKITGLAAPSAASDATNKSFVETTVANAIAANDAMTFKGVVDCGQDGGTTTKPADANANRGDTWKVGRAGTYAGIVAKVGDLLIYEGDDGTKDASKWTHVSSGYEDDYLQKLYVSGNVVHLNNGISASVGGFEVVGSNNLQITVEAGTGDAPVHKIKASMVWGTF